MKTRIILIIAFILASIPAIAQHAAQVDDGAGHYSWLTGQNPGGTFVLPAGGGTLLVSSAPSISSAWLLGGNLSSSPNNQIGTLDATNFDIVTNGLANVRMSINGTTGVVTIANLAGNGVVHSIGGTGQLASSLIVNNDLTSTTYSNITGIGSQSQALNMNSHLINNVTDPSAAQDAATKNYVDNSVANAWALTGNSGTAAGTNFIGTTDNTAFEIHVYNGDGAANQGDKRVMRFEPNATGANIIGGYQSNSVSGGVVVATIAGGGYNSRANSIASNYSTIGGGAGNTIGALSVNSTIAGGVSNSVTGSAGNGTISGGLGNVIVSGDHTTISGGFNNQLQASSFGSTIGGGTNNAIGSHTSVVSGGDHNTIGTSSQFSTIGGGHLNSSTNTYATVVGGQSNSANMYGSFIGGGHSNSTGSGPSYGFVGGGEANQANGWWSSVVGGNTNTATSNETFVGGGTSDNATGFRSAVVGGAGNNSTNSHAFIGAGENNTASGDHSAVVGGMSNTAAGDYSTIGGGLSNATSNIRSTVGGGSANNASGNHSTVAGGNGNTASADWATVGGGYGNTASGGGSFVGGGGYGGGPVSGNTASGISATISGGYNNTASGNYSAIPGGQSLTLSNAGNFGYNGGSTAMTIAQNQVSTFANTDLWLANNDNTARALYFYAPYNTSGAFPNGTKYVGFKAGAVGTSVIWTLPTADATSSGQALTSNAAGVLGWTSMPTVSGTLNAMAKFTGANTVGNSSVTDDGTTVSTSEAVSFTGGATITGTTNINTTGSAGTVIGSASSPNQFVITGATKGIYARISAGDVTGTTPGSVNVENQATNTGGTVEKVALRVSSTGAMTQGNNTGLLFNVSGAAVGTNKDIVGTAGWSVTNTGAATFASGTINGQLDMTSHKIVNLLDPTASQDAATKIYVDTKVNGAVSGTANRLAKFTSANVVGNSLLSDNGTTVTSLGSIVPNATNSFDLGSSSLRWAGFYLAGGLDHSLNGDNPLDNSFVSGHGVASGGLNYQVTSDGYVATFSNTSAATSDGIQIAVNTADGSSRALTVTNGTNFNPTGGVGNRNESFYVKDNGTTFIGTLPASSSTTMVTSNSGVLESRSFASLLGSSAWLIGGNTTGAASTFGSNDAFDVSMVANGTEQLRLRSSGGVEIPVTTLAGVGAFFAPNGDLLMHFPGNANFFAGQRAGNLSVSGSFNTGTGVASLLSVTSGDNNTASGYQSLRANTDGFENSAIGFQSLNSNTSGARNAAVGALSLRNNSIGGWNSGIGQSALSGNTTGSNNTGAGANTLFTNSIGNNNTAVGYQALYNSTSDNNTAVGSNALGTNTTGTLNTAIGANADVTLGGLTNATAIGANAIVSQSNSLVLGNGVNVGIGTAFPSQRLEVKSGNILLSNAGTAGELRFAEPAGSGTNYSSFKAQVQGGDITYTLPANSGSANGDVLTIASGAAGTTPTLAWSTPSSSTGVNYNVTSTQNTATVAASNYLFDVSYAATAADQNARGARIQSTNTASGSNFNATGLSVVATATSTGTAKGLDVSVSGGSTDLAATFSGGAVAIGTSSPTIASNSLLQILNGHLQSKGTIPTVSTIQGAGAIASVSIATGSTDIAGQVTFNSGAGPGVAGDEIDITFNKTYANPPIVVITPVSVDAGNGQAYVTSTASGFSIWSKNPPPNNKAWTYNYIVIEVN